MLPRVPTPLIGRDAEIADVCARMRRPDVRMLTLTGPAGVGKTRLALAVAERLVDEFVHGVRVVELAPLTDPALVLATIARAIEMPEGGSQPLAERLARVLADRHVLLVLDNLEHLLTAAPDLSALLATCPDLALLVTSRAPLGLRWEHEVPVPPLPLPDPSPTASPAALRANPAVALFMSRAEAVRPAFAPDAAELRAVAAICRRLDGLPLAIELAAVRSKVIPPQDLLGRLAQRLPLLVGGPRDAPARQRTLRDAVAWSYDLLSEPEQALFRRLAVFAGGCTIAAAESICNADRDLGRDLIDGIGSLVDKSLLRRDDGPDGESRFAMLETIREFGLERLDACGERATIHALHTAYFMNMAEAAQPHLRTAGRDPWLMRLQAEHDNLRAALEWSRQRRDHATLLRFVAALEVFWRQSGSLDEGCAWADRALDGADDAPADLRARALTSGGGLAWYQGDRPAARRLFEQALPIWRRLEDPAGIATTLGWLGATLALLGEPDTARSFCEESVTLNRQVADAFSLGMSLNQLSLTAQMQGDYAAAQAASEEQLTLCREIGAPWLTAFPLRQLGRIARARGDVEQARKLTEKALDFWREAGDVWQAASALRDLGVLAFEAGDYPHAAATFRESLEQHRAVGFTPGITVAIASLGYVAAMCGQPERAARLLGWAEAHSQGGDRVFHISRTAHGAGIEETVRAALGESSYAAAWAEGGAMPFEEVIAEALAVTVTPAPPRSSSPVPSPPAGAARTVSTPGGLTAREVEVLRLIAAGKTTREIAETLVISPGTVERHVTHLYGKIGAQNRADATSYAFRSGIIIHTYP